MAKDPLQTNATVSMPSADLLNYFIKETKENFADVGSKLDAILAQNAHFISEDKVQKMIDDNLKPINDRFDNYRWYWRAIITAIFLALASSVTALIIRNK